jgi:hypothetical protein
MYACPRPAFCNLRNLFALEACFLDSNLLQLLELVGQISDNDAKLAPALIELQVTTRLALRFSP